MYGVPRPLRSRSSAHAGRRQELIFDPQTAVLLATRSVTASGRILAETTYLERRVVDELP